MVRNTHLKTAPVGSRYPVIRTSIQTPACLGVRVADILQDRNRMNHEPLVVYSKLDHQPAQFNPDDWELVGSSEDVTHLDATHFDRGIVCEHSLYQDGVRFVLITNRYSLEAGMDADPIYEELTEKEAADWCVHNSVRLQHDLEGSTSKKMITATHRVELGIESIVRTLKGKDPAILRYLAANPKGVTFSEFRAARNPGDGMPLTTSEDNQNIATMLRRLSRRLKPHGRKIKAIPSADLIQLEPDTS